MEVENECIQQVHLADLNLEDEEDGGDNDNFVDALEWWINKFINFFYKISKVQLITYIININYL